MDNILGKRIRYLREKKDIKQKEFAKALGISPFQLSRYESGKSKPDPELIATIATFFKVTTDYLLGLSDIPDLNKGEAKELSELEKIMDSLSQEERERMLKMIKAYVDSSTHANDED